MEEQLELSVVMPAYREADSLRMLLPNLVPAVAKLSNRFEIIVADSMTPVDDTAEVCGENGVRCVPRRGGNTYGDAVRSGIESSSGRYVLLMDSDGSHNPAELFKLWNQRGKCDLVIGSRYVRGGSTENPAILILMSRVLNLAYKFAFHLPVADVSNSLRLYRGEQLRSLHLVSSNFDIVEEILIRLVAGKTHATVTEVPVTFEQRKAGESKRHLPTFVMSYFSSMAKMRAFRNEEMAKNKQ
ncbi:glycosyl transferase [Terriglobus roseus DSM 18391]|uniref:Glycosyl transferase n=1 Tax=Terriglobus roseus (strain DSM 18391 / NRRL B-41598 / KBS 63) TaxID=926566 RepID=I3ZG05_TERRK|nr:glycosyltransferase [Terriglobus roseus]AFL88173.1 glycosyl transferase [Terriglobus roseus DSM 18391]